MNTMRTRPWCWWAGLGLLLVGCARLENQTTSTEPHALVTVLKVWEAAEADPKVKALDGRPVQAGRTYRVTPGEHRVTLQVIERSVTSATGFQYGGTGAKPQSVVEVSDSGRMSVQNAAPPFGTFEPVQLKMQNRRIRTTTNNLVVKAGWIYELDGERVRARPDSTRQAILP